MTRVVPPIRPIVLLRLSRRCSWSPVGARRRRQPPAKPSTGAGRQRRVLRLRRPAPGPRREVRGAGPDADDGRVPEEGRVGDRRRPADPGAAEHRRRLVQPRDRRLAGRPRLDQQHVPHQRPAVRATGRRPSTPDVLQAESIAQSAERGGLKVAQVEWAGGRNATIQGPTIDFQSFFSGRGVATNFIGSAGDALFDDAPFIASFGLQFDHPAGYRRARPPFPGAAPTPATGWTGVRRVVQPGDGDAPARPRRRRRQVRPQRLHLRQHQRRHDQLRPGPVLARPRDGADSVGDLRQGRVGRRQGQRSSAAPLDGKTAGLLRQGRGADAATCRGSACSTPRSAAPSPAGRPGRGEPGFTRRLRRVPRPEVPDLDGRRLRRSSRPASRARTPTSSRACTGRPATCRCSSTSSKTYKPDLLLAGYADHRRVPAPVPRPRHADAAQRRAEPGLRRRPPQRRRRTAGSRAREAYIRTAYAGSRRDADARPRRSSGSDPTTFVASDHGFAPQFLAIDASKVARRPRAAVACRRRRTAARPTRRDDRQGQGLLGRRRASRSTSTSPAATRPAPALHSRSPPADEAATVAADQGRVPRR